MNFEKCGAKVHTIPIFFKPFKNFQISQNKNPRKRYFVTFCEDFILVMYDNFRFPDSYRGMISLLRHPYLIRLTELIHFVVDVIAEV